jgi:hypothetical protein
MNWQFYRRTLNWFSYICRTKIIYQNWFSDFFRTMVINIWESPLEKFPFLITAQHWWALMPPSSWSPVLLSPPSQLHIAIHRRGYLKFKAHEDSLWLTGSDNVVVVGCARVKDWCFSLQDPLRTLQVSVRSPVQHPYGNITKTMKYDNSKLGTGFGWSDQISAYPGTNYKLYNKTWEWISVGCRIGTYQKSGMVIKSLLDKSPVWL